MTAPVAVVVLCTAPVAGNAEGRLGGRELAQRLVEERLCACVNLLPSVQSCFRWEGRVESAEEMLLIAKTTPAAAAALRARIVELHPYDLPEVLELPASGGLPAYLAWLADCVES
ncbi:MAG: divalent-cation tolerance protein CutA [Planctomycetes bacterium]|nr:divalent-cation tolerance protein CutA [Planctomycetota bacterium]